MKRRFLLITLMILLVTLCLFACGDGKTSSVTTVTTAPDTPTRTTAETTAKETVGVTTVTPTPPETPEGDITLPEITDTNGLLWYTFEEGEGASTLKSALAQARDSIRFTGSLTASGGIDDSGCASFASGEGIKLNNTFTEWGQITDGTFLHPATQTLSVAFYMMPDSLEGQQMLFEYGSQYRGFSVGIEDGALTVSVTAADSSDADGNKTLLDPVLLEGEVLEKWTHFFLTYDGNLDGGTVTLYLDFKKVASASSVGIWLPKVLDASGVATTDQGSNSHLWENAYYAGKLDDLRIYKEGFTPLPTLEEGVIYLQSAAKKNHYLKATEATVGCASMVEPALRGIVMEKGLADATGVSLRMSGTDRYLTVKDGKVIAQSITDSDKENATFYKTSPLALPTWGEGAADSFLSFSTRDGGYLTAKDGTVSVSTPTDADRLSATFKLTGDQRAVIENIRGVVYYPSYALNAPQFWKWYDSAIIERDMQYAKTLGFNAFRIWVSYEYWLEDPTHFEDSYNDFLSLAEGYDIKIMVSLFEGCGKAEEGYYSANVWSRDYSKAWSITSPCREVYQNSARWDEPKTFVTWFFDKYGNDSRHMAIEIYNEPWGNREACAKYLSEYAITVQGSVPITFGTAPAGSYNVIYSVEAGADMIHYHDNFPGSTNAFKTNAENRINQGRLANLPVYCTEVQWVGGPSGVNYPMYQNLAPTVNKLTETKVWAPFYWTLMVHPCYLDSYRNNYKMKNGIIGEDGSYYSIENAQAIAPEADLSEATENSHNPYDDKFYTYKYTFSDSFGDKNAYKWRALTGSWSASSGAYVGSGVTLANATAFSDFTASFTLTPTSEAGFILRAQNETHYYYAAITVGKMTIYKVAEGEKTVLATTSVEYPGGAVTVSLEAKGNTLRISANCNDCIATDDSYTVGQIGFAAKDSATFDSLLVKFIEE